MRAPIDAILLFLKREKIVIIALNILVLENPAISGPEIVCL
jgi:hypothetical protein